MPLEEKGGLCIKESFSKSNSIKSQKDSKETKDVRKMTTNQSRTSSVYSQGTIARIKYRRLGVLYFFSQHRIRKVIINSHKNLQLVRMRGHVAFMKNAWRKRRDEAKTLTIEVNDQKGEQLKIKNQLHFFELVLAMEKRNNEGLKHQLKMSTNEVRHLESAQKSLQTERVEIEKRRAQAEQRLLGKMQDCHELNKSLLEAKEELFGVISELQKIRRKLNSEKIKLEQLESEKLELFSNFERMSEKARTNIESFQCELLRKDDEILSSQGRLTDPENELEKFGSNMNVSHPSLAEKMGPRIHKCWKNFLLAQQTTLHVIHWFAFALFPAMPAPLVSNPFPFNFTIEKVMKVMKR